MTKKTKFLKIKPFQETLYKSYCAPATLKMLLDYYGVEKSEKELAHLMGTTKDAGTTVEDFVKALKKFGLKAKVKDYATFADIEGYLKKDIPVVVDWFTKGRSDDPEHFTADGHYSIAVGLDKTHIYLQDPEIGRMRKLKRQDFLKVWFDYLGDYLKSPKQLVIREMIAVYR